MQPTVLTFEAAGGERLDTFLGKAMGEPRNQIAHLIKNGHVAVEAKAAAKPGVKLKAGEKVTVTLPQMEPEEAQPIDFDVPILYEDDDLLIINKPSGLTVHPAPSVKEPTLVDWLKHHDIRLSTLSGEERHGIVHRLDKGTSGVMIVAKTNEAHDALSKQLQDKSMGRYYLAVVTPPLKEDLTLVDKPIGRSPHNRLKMAVVPHGKSAQTLFKKLLLSKDEKEELIACKLFTGRTHQIRVHLESFSRHILGDHLYGIKSNPDKIQRILLHAYTLYFTHPRTGEAMRFAAPLPAALTERLQSHFATETLDDETLDPDRIGTLFDTDTAD
ncbi:RluA family pseudouridine synthase [Sulfurimonas sp. HSL-3221]|uniref:RluA family pseudouridine synthase n=1 Tax=Sulfurimonadaceae TaxID=2771471 RepID=UPI001E303BE6|nr:RluA family pseudouridine synthase [Sulfurimonas sp. HSL-3221]UFS63213.1 RluA family pseudouridine synthase [Sulfurimonas sp. HSL-3221]